MNLALFDFDGTITDNDNYTMFINYASSRKRRYFSLLILFPVIFGYKRKYISSAKTREIVAGFIFRGSKIDDIMEFGRRYSLEIIPGHIRNNALDRIRWHKEQGDKVVVVSASLDVYLKHWCETHGLDLICTCFETKNGIITGKYSGGDCSGIQKAERVLERYNVSDFETVYAYGDTAEDTELLDLASVKYFRWKEVSSVPSSITDCDKRKNTE